MLTYLAINNLAIVEHLELDLPEGMTVILTGRDAPEKIIKAADLVSEIENVKHPAEQGAPPCRGIEY